MADAPDLGIVGLGKIGGNLALQALEKGARVAGFDLAGASEELREAGLVEVEGLAGFADALDPPRVVFVYVPAGPVVDDVLDELADALDEGDVLVDGGNSYWGDSIRRSERFGARGLHFVDCGTSGGLPGARYGACFMYGATPEAAEHVEPIVHALAVDGGTVHAGPPGAGHFVKLVHNGIEFGMLQAIAEGVGLLDASRFDLDTPDVLRCWTNGSVIRSWLVELMERVWREEGGTGSVPPFVEDTGEVSWLVNDAHRMGVPIPVIAQSVQQLFVSRDDDRVWARAVAMMRHGFGGHPFGADESIRRERAVGRVGPYPEEPDPS